MKVKILTGCFFAGILLLLAFVAAGSGHGSDIFFSAAMPYGAGLLVYPLLFALTEHLDSTPVKIIYLLTVAVHYCVTAVFIFLWWNDDFPYLIKVWAHSPFSVLLPLVWYLAGQFYIWLSLFKSFSLKEIK